MGSFKGVEVYRVDHGDWFDETLQHPFTSLICGATQSGKTFFVKKLLQSNSPVIEPAQTRIVWCYGEYQSAYDDMAKTVKPNITFIQGIPLELYETFQPGENNLPIIDDLMSESGSDKQVTDLFTNGSHHRNLSIIYILQNIFNPLFTTLLSFF